MKKLVLALVFLGLNSAALAVTPTSTASPSPTPSITPTAVVLPPTGLKLGVLQPGSTISLSWDADGSPTRWALYFNGVLNRFIARSDVWVSSPGVYSYLVTNLPQGASSLSLTLLAMVPGKPTSPPSDPVLLGTAAAPFGYVASLGTVTLDRFTDTGAGTVHGLPSIMQSYSIEVCGEGGNLNSWTFELQGSLDGTNFTTILTHNSTECSTLSTAGSFYPYSYLRVNCTALDLGTADDALVLVNGLP